MYRKRRLGVEEGNAIDDIVAYEMRQKRGVATTSDKLAHDKACQFLGIRQTTTNVVHPAFRVSSQEPPPSNQIINPIDLGQFWQPFKMIGALFLLWALGCVLLYMVVMAVGSLVSLAHP